MRAGVDYLDKKAAANLSFIDNARGHIDTKPVYVYTEQIFVGYYIYIIVAYKKICICLYRDKNDTNYVSFIVGVKKLCIFIQKQ